VVSLSTEHKIVIVCTLLDHKPSQVTVMLTKELMGLSLENIAHQKDRSFFNAITTEMKRVVDGSTRRGEFLVHPSIEKIRKLITDRTGLNIELIFSYEIGYNASVRTPALDKNHILYESAVRTEGSVSNRDLRKHLREANRKFTGTIDILNGRVSGDYSKIVSSVYVGPKLFDILTPEEVSAILLHEIGHLMTYYFYLGRVTIMNHCLGEVLRTFTETESPARRVEILKVIQEECDLDGIDVENISKIKSGVQATQMVAYEFISEYSSVTNTPTYDIRTWEAVSDQYVSRMGGAVHLATGLDMMHRLGGDVAYRGKMAHYATQLGNLLTVGFFAGAVGLALTMGSALGLLFIPAVIIASIAFADNPADIYEPIGKRLNSIRKDVIDAMKDKSLTRAQRRELSDDLAKLDEVIKPINENINVFDALRTIFRPTYRRESSRIRMIQQLEELANNRLFAIANKLQTM
jgi:hypothetical protein